MPKISEIYAGQFVNAAELPMGRRLGAVITAASAQPIGQGDQAAVKIVLELRAHDGRAWPKAAVLNKVNAVTLAGLMGDDTVAWIGRSIEVWREKVMFGGRLVDGLRMTAASPPPAGNSGAIPMPAPAVAAAPPTRSIFDDGVATADHLDDEIPY
jgi:hypothetical protein